MQPLAWPPDHPAVQSILELTIGAARRPARVNGCQPRNAFREDVTKRSELKVFKIAC
jgi:hypothetical protein